MSPGDMYLWIFPTVLSSLLMKLDSCKLSISIHDQVQPIQHLHLVAEPVKDSIACSLVFL